MQIAAHVHHLNHIVRKTKFGARTLGMFFQEQAIIGNLNIAPAVNWAGKNSKDYTRLFLEVRSIGVLL